MLAKWTRAISTGALLLLAFLVIAVCSPPPQPEPPTEVKPASTETVTQDQGKDSEPDSGQRESEFVDPKPMASGEPTAEVVQQPVQEAETAVEVEHSQMFYDRHFGAAVASLEERAYLADVVVRANLVSAANDVLTFTAIEYLKGSGPTAFTVSATTANRNTQWDASEAILFLSDSTNAGGDSGTRSTDTTFDFVDSTEFDYSGGDDTQGPFAASSYAGDLGDGYTIDTQNPVWTPAKGQSSGTRSTGGSTGYIAEAETPAGDVFPTFTLEELREIIAWIEGGEGIEGYEECVLWGLRDIRYWRDWNAHEGPLPDVEGPLQAESGVVGVDIRQTSFVDLRSPYSKRWLEGDDAKYFTIYNVDDDDVASNGYGYEIAAVRPLPAGEYRIWPGIQHGYFQPCDYIPSDIDPSTVETGNFSFNVVVTAPEGTVWEALFDPDATGFSSGGGELTPVTYTANSITSTITALKYENGKVVLETDPFNNLSGLHLHLIRLDGTIDLALPRNSATRHAANKRLTWDVPDAPWADGDKLMLRLTSVALPNSPPEDSSGR